METYIPKIVKNDVILPLFTKPLREYLLHKLHKEREEAKKKMKQDGWGVTKFGSPNPEFYGDYTHHFYNHFWRFLDENLKVIEEMQMSGKFHMRAGEIVDNSFYLLPLNYVEDTAWHKYFEGFKFNIKDYGKDFYKISVNYR